MKTFDDLKKGDVVWKVNINLDVHRNIFDYGGYINIEKWFVKYRYLDAGDKKNVKHSFRFADSDKIAYNHFQDVYLTASDNLSNHSLLEHLYPSGYLNNSLIVIYGHDYDDEDDPELYFYSKNSGPDYFISDLAFVREFIRNFQDDLNIKTKSEMRKIKKNLSSQRRNFKEIFKKIDGLEQISE